MNVKSEDGGLSFFNQLIVVNILMGLWKALANGECNGGDNNDVVALEKLQGELGWVGPE